MKSASRREMVADHPKFRGRFLKITHSHEPPPSPPLFSSIYSTDLRNMSNFFCDISLCVRHQRTVVYPCLLTWVRGSLVGHRRRLIGSSSGSHLRNRGLTRLTSNQHSQHPIGTLFSSLNFVRHILYRHGPSSLSFNIENLKQGLHPMLGFPIDELCAAKTAMKRTLQLQIHGNR